MTRHSPEQSGDQRRRPVPDLALTHGQTLWLMAQLGLRGGVSASTFNHYVKSLRVLGVPFVKGKGQSGGRRHVTYDFEELMELAVALLLRVYGALPDTVVTGLRDFRVDLRPIYRQAYLNSLRTIHPPARIAEPGGPHVYASGVFLDLNIRFAAGQMVEFGPPKALSPFEAMKIFASSEVPARSYLPLNISTVAAAITERAQSLPPMRRPRRDRGLTAH